MLVIYLFRNLFKLIVILIKTSTALAVVTESTLLSATNNNMTETYAECKQNTQTV